METVRFSAITILLFACLMRVATSECPPDHKLYPAKEVIIGVRQYICSGVCQSADQGLEVQRASNGQQACCCRKPAVIWQWALKALSERVEYASITSVNPKCSGKLHLFISIMPALKFISDCGTQCAQSGLQAVDFRTPQSFAQDRRYVMCCCAPKASE